jgi:hypothetical protein
MTQEFGNANAQIKPIDVTVTLGVGAGEYIIPLARKADSL